MSWRALAVAAALVPVAARAQAPAVPEVCMIYPGTPANYAMRIEAALLAGLRDQRFEVGRDVTVTLRAADFDWARMPALAAECVARQPRVIAAISPTAVLAVHAATRSIPIVVQDLETDPVAAGLVVSLRRPGGNLSGFFFDFPDFGAKWLELVGEALPALQRIGVLWDPQTGTVQIAAVRALAAARGLALVEQQILELATLEQRFQALAEARVQAVLLMSSPVVSQNSKRFADLALAHRLPTITMFPEYAKAGGLMAYGPDIFAMYRPMGDMIGKVLRGAQPADLPIERPARMILVVNLATARALGVGLSPALLGRADEVVE